MTQPQKTSFIKNAIVPSVVVFMIAITLCMGIAVACGMPPASGLLSGIIGGIVAGALSGCRLQVSGPAAGLTAVVIALLAERTRRSGGKRQPAPLPETERCGRRVLGSLLRY